MTGKNSKITRYYIYYAILHDVRGMSRIMETMKITANHEKEKKNCCEKPNLGVNYDSMKVCLNCGFVKGKTFINEEKRAYNYEELKKRKRTEPRWRTYGPRTVIGSGYLTDGHGSPLKPENLHLFARLTKIQSSLINSFERNLWDSKPKLINVSNCLGLPSFVQETAWNIYFEVAHQKLTMGRSILAFISAAIYAAIRIHNFPRIMEEILEVTNAPARNVNRALGLVVRHVLPKMQLKYNPIEPKALIYRFGEELHIGMKYQKRAVQILTKAKKRGLQWCGKDPKGLAAASLYIASKNTCERRTQSEISNIARITEVTLRTRAKQISQYH